MALAGLALGVTPALAAKNCGRQIIDDWFKDGRVDKVYALHCYDEALDQLPNDVRTYSDAPQAIKRALQQALAKGAPVDEGDSGTTTPGDTTPTETTSNPDEPAETTPTTSTTPSDGPGGPTGTGGQALGDESSSASSVPLPLLVLAGLALLLLAAGGAGYLNRRRQASRIDGGTDDEPPAEL